MEFEFGSKESMSNALNVSKASVVVIITDMVHIAKHREIEVEHATIMMDACAEAPTKPHVILCSSYLCDTAPEEAQHLTSKADMETYLQQKSGISNWSILRPASFFENFDSDMNPLKRGKLADLYPPDCKIPLIATRDIGTAAVQMANNPKKWNHKTLDCVSCFQSGDECACVLTAVSGVLCYYKQSPLPFFLRLFLPSVYHMVQFNATGLNGHADNVNADIQKFRSVVPNAMGPREWFESKGRWADGSKFNEPSPPPSNNIVAYIMLSMPILIIAIVVALEMKK